MPETEVQKLGHETGLEPAESGLDTTGVDASGDEANVQGSSMADVLQEPSSSPVLRGASPNPDTNLHDGEEAHRTDSETSPSPTDSGLPSDGYWPWSRAYGRRYCRKHKKLELLIGYDSTWVSFGDSASVVLPRFPVGHVPELDPMSVRCQAECDAHLLSEVFAVLEVRNANGVEELKCMWAPQWTKAEDINNLEKALKMAEKYQAERGSSVRHRKKNGRFAKSRMMA